MARARLADDELALSEITGVLVLVVFTIAITATIGVNVLFVSEEDPGGPPEANFTYSYISESSVLIVGYEFGDPIDAGNLTVAGPEDNNVTWAQLADVNETTVVSSNESAPRTIQLSRNTPYGEAVTAQDKIRVIYTPPSGNETVLSRWDN